MSGRKFNRLMVDLEIGRHLKLVGLTDSEWRAHVGGILPIAAKSNIRGRLLVGDERARPEHVAAQAGVKARAATTAMEKLRALGVLLEDEEFDCERVHDFEFWNPPPKVDATAAERQQRRRDRLRTSRQGHAAVTLASRRDTRDITPPEVEGGITEDKGRNPLEGSPLGVVGMSNVAGEASR